MGGERAATSRMRLAGKVCCWCKNSLPPPHSGRETSCARCTEQMRPRRKVYCHFMAVTGGWYCQFLEADLRTPLARKLMLQSDEKVWELARRGGASMILEDKHALEAALRTGRGSVWLNLTPDQYARLRKSNA